MRTAEPEGQSSKLDGYTFPNEHNSEVASSSDAVTLLKEHINVTARLAKLLQDVLLPQSGPRVDWSVL